jgi:L-lactate dehydrogenase complex protein LldG
MGKELVEKFVTEAKATAAVVTPVPDTVRAAQAVGEILKASGVQQVALGSLSEPLRAGVEEAISRSGVELVELAVGPGVEAVVAEAGLGIAETGTVVLPLNDYSERLVALSSRLSVFVLDETNIRSSLEEALEEIGRRWLAGAGFVSLISGPSRTADIERCLTRGVHGPGEVHLVLISDALIST